MAKKNEGTGGTGAGGGTATAVKRAPRPPIESAEKLLKRQIGLLPQTEVTQQLRDGLEGLVRMLQTVDQVMDSTAPPAADSAWGKAVQIGKGRRLMAATFAAPASAAF